MRRKIDVINLPESFSTASLCRQWQDLGKLLKKALGNLFGNIPGIAL